MFKFHSELKTCCHDMKVSGYDLRRVESYSAAFAFHTICALGCPIHIL